MKHYIYSLLLLFLIGFQVSGHSQVTTVSSSTNSPGQYTDLQQAIDNAQPGDTIYVHGGDYSTITVDKQLTLIGPGYNIQGQFTSRAWIPAVILDKNIPYTSAKGSRFIGLHIGYIVNLGGNQHQIDDIVFERCHFTTNTLNRLSGNNWVFKNNWFSWAGSGCIFINEWDTIVIANNIFNTTDGVLVIRESNKDSVLITNNLFLGGYQNSNQFDNITNALFENNIFFGKTPQGAANSVFNNNITFGYTPPGPNVLPYGSNTGSNNLSNTDPLFKKVPQSSSGGKYVFSFDNDYRLGTVSPGLNAGTDGQDIGLFGGPYPMLLNDTVLTGEPRMPQVFYLYIHNSVIQVNTAIDVTFQARAPENIVDAEFFINTDPGVGNGTPISTGTPDTSVLASFNTQTTGLSPGFHHLFVRVKDINGVWSLYTGRGFLIKTPKIPPAPLYIGEYFFNDDPGVGNGTPVNFTSADSVNVTFPTITSSLQPGFNHLFFRAKDQMGRWSIYSTGVLYVKKQKPSPAPLNYAEYFFDTDPGVGNGVPFSYPIFHDSTITKQIATTGLSAGEHRLFFRFRDTTNLYSIYAGQTVRLCDIAALANFEADTVCLCQDSTTFVNLSTGGDANTVYKWDFNGNGTIDLQHTGLIGSAGAPMQFRYKYLSGGTFDTRLITDNGGGCSDTIVKPVVVISYPPLPTPVGPNALCIGGPPTTYSIPHIQDATSYYWEISPTNAVDSFVVSQDTSLIAYWNSNYVGNAQIKAGATYGPCDSISSAPMSPPRTVTISLTSAGGTISIPNSSICLGSSTGNMTLSGHQGNIIMWQRRHNNGTWQDISSSTNPYSETPASHGIWDYRAIVKSGGCDTVHSNTVSINVLPIPLTAGSIIGPTEVCQGQQQVAFSVPPVTGATDYTWTTYQGATIESGQGTNSILVSFNLGTSGAITVQASNQCGTGGMSPPHGVNVNPSPIVTVTPYPDIDIPINTTTSLSGSASGGTPPYSYSWTPSALVDSANSQTTETKELQNSTIFTLTVTDSLGCTGSRNTNVIITGVPLSAWAFPNPSSICPGQNSQLTVVYNGGNPPYSFSWSSNPSSVFADSVQYPIVSPTVTTQYTVTVTDGNQQTTSAMTTLFISPTPSAAGAITGASSVCAGDVGVSFSVPPVTNATSYSWDLPVGATISSGANTNNIIVSFGLGAQSGTIKVAGVNLCGKGDDSPAFPITVNPLPDISAGSDQYITNGTSTTLNASVIGGSGNFTFEWAPASHLLDHNIQNPQTVNLSSSMTFSLTVTDNVTGCSNTDNMQVIVQGYPLSVISNAIPSSICQGESSQINALPGGGTGNYTFEWSSNPAGFTSTDQSPVVTPNLTTTYTVTVTDGAHTETSAVVVSVYPKPAMPNAISGPTQVCPGDKDVPFSVPSINHANAYHWIMPPGATISSGAGTNSITVNFSLGASSGDMMVYGSNFCGIGDTSAGHTITVHDLPIADAGPDSTINYGQSIVLQGSASGGSGSYSYYWTPTSALTNHTVLTPLTEPLYNSVYFIFTLTDIVTGCTSTSTTNILVKGGVFSATANANPSPPVCENTLIQLNALPTGGSGDFAYEWTSNPPGFSSFNANPTVTPTVTTEYIVEVEDLQSLDVVTASILVTVNPLPSPADTIVGPQEICQGETGVVYSVPSISNATSYQWDLPPGAVISAGQGTHTITVNFLPSATSGDITVMGQNFCGNGPVSPALPIVIDSLPIVNAGPTQYISQGDNAILDGSASSGSGNFSYSWEPAGLLVNPSIPNPTTISLSSSHIFTLTVTDLVTGCENTSQTQVVVTGVPLSVSADAGQTSLCEGSSTTLTALPTGGIGSYSYTWSAVPPDTSLTNPNQQNPVVTPNETTTYTVTIDDGNNTATDDIIITVISYPETPAPISGPTSICVGESGVLYSIPSIPDASSYVWELPTGATIASGLGTNTIVVDFSSAVQVGTAEITVKGVNSCGDGPKTSLSITINPVLTVSANVTPQPLPSGSPASLSSNVSGGSGSYSYQWAPAFYINSGEDTLQNPTTTNLTNFTTFTVTVTDNQTGCYGTGSVSVYISHGGPLAALANATPQTICDGQQTQLNVVPSGGVGNYQYTWSSSPAGFSSTLQDPIASPSVSTTYYVTVTSGAETASAATVVNVSPVPAAASTITGLDTVCQNTSGIIYSVPHIPNTNSYIWDLPPGVTAVSGSNSNNITVNFGPNAQSGVITVQGENFCGTGPSSPDFNVIVHDSPIVDAGTDITINSGDPANLNGSVIPPGGNYTYQWTPNFFTSSSLATQLQTNTQPLFSSVTFTLTVTDTITGCTGSAQVNVYVTDTSGISIHATPQVSTICAGDSIQLNSLPSGGTGNYGYSWTTMPPSGFNSTSQNPVVSPTVTTQYIVHVTDIVTGQSATDNVTVFVSPIPAAADSITGSSMVCQNETNVQYCIPPVPHATGYVWSLPLGASIASGNNTNCIYVNFAANADPGTISVYPYNDCGIGGISPLFHVDVKQAPTAYISGSQVIPYNDSTFLFGHAIGGSGIYSYSWEPASHLLDANVQNCTTVNLTQSTTFDLFVTDGVTGCQSNAQTQVIVFMGPSFTVNASSNMYDICSGQTVQLNALPTGGSGAYAYEWTPSTGLSNDTIANPTASPTVTTTYTVSVVSEHQSVPTTVTDQVVINVTSPPGSIDPISGSQSVCKGETGVLYSIPPVDNATSYHWTLPFGASISSGHNTNTIMVNFSNIATSGNISVYASNMCGYSNTSPNFYVIVNDLPSVNAGADQTIPYNPPSGVAANLNGQISGSGQYSHYWTPSSLVINPYQLSTSTHLLTQSEIFTLHATDSITGCYNSDYMKVIVCGGPLSVIATASSTNICEGEFVHLDALPSGGDCTAYSYSWVSSPGGDTINIANPLVSPTVTTTYTITVDDSSTVATDTIVINVQPLVAAAGAIQGPQLVCQNSGIGIYSTDPIHGAQTYDWSFPSGVVIITGADSNVVEVLFTDSAQSGHVSVFGSNLCGFGPSSPLLPVTVKPLPGSAGTITGPSYLSKGNNIVQFSVPPIPNTYTYNWILPYGADIIHGYGTNSITVEFTDDAKSGFVTVFGINSCGTGDPATHHLVTIITSLAERYNIELKLYPNPTKGELTLEFVSEEDIRYSASIYNLLGTKVYNSAINKSQTQFDLGHLANGMYYLVLENEHVRLVEKFIIMQ